MAKIEPFEHHLDEYEQWFVKNRWAYLSEIKAVKALLPTTGKGVEIGVGSGLFAEPLGIKLGVEPSPRMADLARKRGIKVLSGVAEKLPLENEHYDFALMVTTVCFLDDVPQAFREVHRILKKEGTFLIGFIDRESPLGKLYESFKEQNVFYRWATFFSVQELVDLLQNAGFANFVFKQTIFKPLEQITAEEPVKSGYGEGSFVVIRAQVQK